MGKRNIIYLYQRPVENMGIRMCDLIHPELLLGFNLRLRDFQLDLCNAGEWGALREEKFHLRNSLILKGFSSNNSI